MATQAANSDASTPVNQPPLMQEPQAQARSSSNSGIQVIRRNGKVTHFDPGKISVAMTKAFLAVEGGSAA
ncbi:MAG: hypothetical protein G8D61_19375, partial [gamma proteobacterium symbiont of Ctena orbiculata]